MNIAEEIIEAVRRREILWNVQSKNYKNVKIKAKEWKSISEELNLPTEVVKKKWRCLRDTYARNLNKKKVLCQGTDDLEPAGKHSAQMEFLRYHLKPKLTIGNYVQTAEEESRIPMSPAPPTPEFKFFPCNSAFSDVEEAGSITSSHQVLPSSSNTGKRKRIVPQTSLIDKTFLNMMSSVQELISKPRVAPAIVVESPWSSSSEDELFCRSLMQKLSTFPIELRNSTKLEMLRYINDVQNGMVASSKTEIQ